MVRRVFESRGLSIRISVPYAALLESLLAVPELELRPAEPGRTADLEYQVDAGGNSHAGWYQIWFGARRLAWATTRSAAERLLVSHLESKLAELARDQIFVHAGVVAWRGSALLFPGRSFTGKSTLVAEFLRRGATYFSDEFAVVGPDGLVYPYPRPLHLRRGLAFGPGEEWDPMTVKLPLPAAGIPPRAIIFSGYVPGSRLQWRALSPGRALLLLLSHALGARRHPVQALKFLSPIAAGAPAYAVRRGEVKPAVEKILRMLFHRGPDQNLSV